MKKRLIILGSTGSIGTRTLDVVRDFARHFDVVALSTNGQTPLLEKQCEEFHPQAICVTSPDKADEALTIADRHDAQCFLGEAGLVDMIKACNADLIMVATVGFVGTAPTLAAIDRGMTIALANKEVLVCAGEIVMRRAREAGVAVLPVDSEHNAIFQCLHGMDITGIRKLILTASGGPFRGMTQADMTELTAEDALKHPTWNMGAKITIDCSTLMNKGFEVIEAAHLFDIPVEQVDVVVHPQSTIHSMVEYLDGSIIAQMGLTDMYFPIQNILLYPERQANHFPSLDFTTLGQLTFFAPDRENFPCLDYAYEAVRRGNVYPTLLNAANEVAVARFLEGEIGYLDIPRTIRATMDVYREPLADELTMETISAADRWAREFARSGALAG